jgi:uncharacterized protein involved in type VI secretion and phage assembly
MPVQTNLGSENEPIVVNGEEIHSKAVVGVTVLIDGTPVKSPVQSIRLQQSAQDHHKLTLVSAIDLSSSFENELLTALDTLQNSMGKSINIKIQPFDEYIDQGDSLEFFGIITSVSIASSMSVYNRVTIEAKSPTFLMDQAAVFNFYQDMTFEDVVKKVLSKYNIETGTVKITGAVKNDFWAQWVKTDWEYIAYNYNIFPSWLFYDGKKLHLDVAKSRNTHELTWQKHVGAARMEANVADFQFKNYDWDEKQKQSISKELKDISTQFSGLTQEAYKASKAKFAKLSNFPIPARGKQAELDKASSARQMERVGTFLECYLQTNVPSLKVGDTLSIKGQSKHYEGVYIIKSVIHNVIDTGDYYNHVVAVPLEAAYPSFPPARKEQRCDPLSAIVTDNKDPEKRGRIKVKFPYKGEDGSDLESPWLRIISGYAGAGRGIYYIPEIADEVLVGFESGSPQLPVVLGSLWNGKDKPDASCCNDKNDYKVIYSRSGHQLILSDEDGKETIKLLDKTGKNTMIIDSATNSISITADKDYTLTVKGNVTLKADGDFSLEAANVSIKASQDCKIEALNITAKASAQATYSASANWKAEGAMIDISSKGPCTVTGLPIKLN